jgi:hypothetical protein
MALPSCVSACGACPSPWPTHLMSPATKHSTRVSLRLDRGNSQLQTLRRIGLTECTRTWMMGRHDGCVGQDSNLGTPAGRDLESLAFDLAWLPTHIAPSGGGP